MWNEMGEGERKLKLSAHQTGRKRTVKMPVEVLYSTVQRMEVQLREHQTKITKMWVLVLPINSGKPGGSCTTKLPLFTCRDNNNIHAHLTQMQ